MGSGSSFNCNGQRDLLVDRLLGDSYRVVEYLVRNYDDIKKVADALNPDMPGKPLISHRILELEAILGNFNSTLTINLPSLVRSINILKIDSIVYLSNDTIKYFNNPSLTLYTNEETINIVNFDAALANKPIKLIVTYKE